MFGRGQMQDAGAAVSDLKHQRCLREHLGARVVVVGDLKVETGAVITTLNVF